MAQPIAKTNSLSQRAATLAVSRTESGSVGAVVQRDFDVFQNGVLSDQVVRLKDEADHLIADRGQFVVGHLGDLAAAQDVFAGCGSIEENRYGERVWPGLASESGLDTRVERVVD